MVAFQDEAMQVQTVGALYPNPPTRTRSGERITWWTRASDQKQVANLPRKHSMICLGMQPLVHMESAQCMVCWVVLRDGNSHMMPLFLFTEGNKMTRKKEKTGIAVESALNEDKM